MSPPVVSTPIFTRALQDVAVGVEVFPLGGTIDIPKDATRLIFEVDRTTWLATERLTKGECVMVEIQVSFDAGATWGPFVSFGLTDDGELDTQTGKPYAVSRVRVPSPGACQLQGTIHTLRPKVFSLVVSTE